MGYSLLEHYWFCVKKTNLLRHRCAHGHALIIKNVIFAKIEMVMVVLFPSNLQACLIMPSFCILVHLSNVSGHSYAIIIHVDSAPTSIVWILIKEKVRKKWERHLLPGLTK